ncbi:MAG: hypothetical protein ABEJ06_00125 [Haloarculaceae archaeon]
MTETERAKRALREVVDRTAPDDRAVVEAAAASTADLEAAARFVESVGLDRLDRAVRDAEHRGEQSLATTGREALSTFRAFRRAARDGDHFHSAHGTPLGGDGQGKCR